MYVDTNDNGLSSDSIESIESIERIPASDNFCMIPYVMFR